MDAALEDPKKELKDAFDAFVKAVEEAKKKHADTIGNILRDINDMRIKEIREKLGLK